MIILLISIELAFLLSYQQNLSSLSLITKLTNYFLTESLPLLPDHKHLGKSYPTRTNNSHQVSHPFLKCYIYLFS